MVDLLFETPRLRTRLFTLEDAELLCNLNSDPEVIRYVGEKPCDDVESAKKILDEIILPQYSLYHMGRLAVELKETGEFIGWCGIKKLVDSDEYDLGYRFFRKHWRKGYGGESAKAALDWGHSVRGLKKIIGKADILNLGSVKVLEKIGMKFERFGTECHGKTAVYSSIQ
jgi:ribosomal-protein-alanine N-acetyltransferase